jgi:hypothetical protein
MDFVQKVVIKDFNKIKDLVSNIEKSLSQTKQLTKAVEKTNDAAKKLEGTTKKISKNSSDASDSFKVLTRGTIVERVTDFNKKMSSMNQHWKNVGGIKGFGKILNTTLKSSSVAVLGFSKSVIAAVMGIGAVFAPITAVILAVVAVFLVMKRMWTLNIGGMQTSWFKIMGKIQDTWSRFVIMFDKSLRKLSPLFKVVFKTMEMIILPIIAAIQGFFEGTFAGLQPILNAIEELFTPLMEAFNIGEKGEGFQSFLKGIQITFKGLGYIIRVAFLPLELIIKALAIVFKWTKQIWDVFRNFMSKNVFLKAIYDGLMMILNPLKMIYELFKKISEISGKIKGFFSKEKDEEGAETEKERGSMRRRMGALAPTNSQNVTNNNQSVSVHPLVAQTPTEYFNYSGGALNLYNRGVGDF